MWMAELSERSGIPVATIKFYLREGLLPGGEATGATRARYDESHVRRLRLIRALADVGGLRLDDIRRVLTEVDDESRSLHEVLSAAHSRLSAGDGTPPSGAASARVATLAKRRRWRVDPAGPHANALARALDVLADLDAPLTDDALDSYATTADSIAAREFEHFPAASRESAARDAVVLTVLIEPVLLTLRRLAHENLSTRRFSRRRR
jgi:DNA-binding transcriptional MerR regulator